MVNDDLQQLCINLKLKAIAARFDEMCAAAEAAGTPFPKLMAALLRAEWHARQEQALAARIHRARFPEPWTLETFPFKQQTGVKQRQIRTLAELDFISKAENITFIGDTGVGKTGLMSGIGLKATQSGYKVLFIKAHDLFEQMFTSRADHSTRKLVQSLARVDLLCIDELGFIDIKPEQAHIFFKVIEERHHRRPTLITTNLQYTQWEDFLGNPTLTKALLSRLRERCHTIIIDGPCLRPQTG
jgi:DNA replication protein DnaC